jgi:cell division GTPase FtsZ
LKVVVIGLGQCGGRIADEFARMNRRARADRGIEIVTDTFAINTDTADLSGLSNIRADHRHRILIGGRQTGGHGVGKINEVAADIAKEDADKVIDAVRTARKFYESDAFLLAAGTAGGTGSGSVSVVANTLKQRYMDKPVYALLALPFEHEESTEDRTVYNTAICLKSINSIVDAVFLVDNQRYIKKDASLKNNMVKINELIAKPFYDLLSVGEEKKSKYIGYRLLDAGDIMQTLAGWTLIGYGESLLPTFRMPFRGKLDFIKKSTETNHGVQAMDGAISELSLECDLNDASRALYLLSGPAKDLNMDIVKDLGNYLKGIASEAIIRYGDYPRRKDRIAVTVILSELKQAEKVKQYYNRFPEAVEKKKRIEDDLKTGLEEMWDASTDIPSLV